MDTIKNKSINEDNDALVITRIFDAPRELVWKKWTDAEQMKSWWGPKDFTSPVYKIDLHAGGEYFGCMRSPEGQDFCSRGEFREIVPQERLVMTDSFADKEGHAVPASYYGMGESWPMEMLISVTFEDIEGKTRLTLKHSGLKGFSEKDCNDLQQGWSQSFDKLGHEFKSIS